MDADVELVRAGLAAYNSRDIDAALAALDPACELQALRSLLDGTTYVGHRGVTDFLADMAEEWESWRLDEQEVRALPDGRVLLLCEFVARGRASGVEVRSPAAWVCELRSGLIVRIRGYSDPALAFAELGISG